MRQPQGVLAILFAFFFTKKQRQTAMIGVIMIDNGYKILNRNHLKIIAVVAMTMDHIAASFFTSGTALWFVFRFVGRISFPIMAYMLAEGFVHTRNLKKYVTRMVMFSVVSWVTFSFLETGSIVPIRLVDGNYTDFMFNRIYIPSLDKTLCICWFSVITGLLCSLLCLVVWEKTEWLLPLKILATSGLFLITCNCDWYWLNIPLVLCFYYFRNNRSAKWSCYITLSLLYIFGFWGSNNIFTPYLFKGLTLYRLGMFIPIILIECFFNGKKRRDGTFEKWFFYIYYPAHQIILGILMALIGCLK